MKILIEFKFECAKSNKKTQCYGFQEAKCSRKLLLNDYLYIKWYKKSVAQECKSWAPRPMRAKINTVRPNIEIVELELHSIFDICAKIYISRKNGFFRFTMLIMQSAYIGMYACRKKIHTTDAKYVFFISVLF